MKIWAIDNLLGRQRSLLTHRDIRIMELQRRPRVKNTILVQSLTNPIQTLLTTMRGIWNSGVKDRANFSWMSLNSIITWTLKVSITGSRAKITKMRSTKPICLGWFNQMSWTQAWIPTWALGTWLGTSRRHARILLSKKTRKRWASWITKRTGYQCTPNQTSLAPDKTLNLTSSSSKLLWTWETTWASKDSLWALTRRCWRATTGKTNYR